MTVRRILAASLLFAVIGCSKPAPQPSPPPPVVTPAPAPAPPVAMPRFDNWMDAPATPGDWTYRSTGRERLAEFRGASGNHLFHIACSADRTIKLVAPGAAPRAGMMQIRTEELSRAVSADSREGMLTATLQPRDPLLAAMAFSKGRFAVEAEGLAPLYLPAWAEVTRVIEDCLPS